MGNKPEKKFTGQKLLYMLFALLTAIVLWLYVSITDMPDITMSVSGVQVEMNGAEVLTDRELVVTDISSQTVTLTFKGSREQIYNLDNSNVKVVIDLSDIDSPGKYSLHGDIEYDKRLKTSSLSVAGSSSEYIDVTVEKLTKKVVPVTGVNDGGVEEGYIAEPMEISPDTVTVYGPEKMLNQVSYAMATFKHENLSASVSESVPVVLMDANDKQVDMDEITVEPENVDVSIAVNVVKSVPLSVEFKYGAGTTEDNGTVSYSIEPDHIELTGDPTVLNELDGIVLTTIDLNQFVTSDVFDIPIKIPDNCKNLSGNTDATVSVEITGLSSAKLSAKNISCINENSAMNTEIITESLDITLRGPADVVSKVTADNIRIVADLEGINSNIGQQTVNAKVNVDGYSNVGAIGTYQITVKISKKT